MSVELLNIIGLSLIGSVAGIAGGVVFLFKKHWAKVLGRYAVPFAAGVLLSVSLLHLIPEAEHGIGENAYVIVLLAFLGAFIFEHAFAHLHHHEHNRHHVEKKATVPLVLFGDTIHNFIDGVAIAAAYLTDPSFGLIVALATFLHETPHEIGDFGVLIGRGWTRAKTFWANLLSALFTIPGALFVYYLVGTDDAHGITGTLLAVSAGIFLYLGASDFLPEVGEDEKDKIGVWYEILLVIIGVLIMMIMMFLTPEH